MTSEPTTLASGGTNAVGRIMGLLGDEWTLLIVQQALLGATRYGEFMQRLPISNTVLANRLRVLVDNGLLDRVEYQTRPVRAEYLITQRGRAFWPVLLSIWEWERRWVPEHAHRLPGMRHTECGGAFAPTLTCRACGEAVTEKEVSARWGPSGSWPRSVPDGSTRRRSGAGQAGLFPETMSVFGNRWAAALLVCAFLGTSRFSDFQTQLGAPPSLLSDRLQTFCANGVLCTSREANYRLTEKGRAFFPVIIAALQCGQHWFHAPEGPAVLLTHVGCGKPFVGQLTCDQCARPLKGAHVDVD
ncbi:winged helix-turn-helix transcriptional regulator [Candidatus Mycobacterium wuenschmannii]|uniref:Winged helix-turn-helix transcriptional regulator n=1 Tax=Candidatus Mycobacterium wuenschmannii TaxID=3027808 RepID=A0ABY8VQN2_9MYCO|nr:winged helix-turn-helix transcriptional regulator [Candidatus Mycobacterium wuenschmannii]WIM85955.1 winged helix-turn-helix transcriptional regulator [Candidatus Mycobacterium wuenschmannii]